MLSTLNEQVSQIFQATSDDYFTIKKRSKTSLLFDKYSSIWIIKTSIYERTKIIWHLVLHLAPIFLILLSILCNSTSN